MNRFSYSITTHFIPSNKDYHSCCNLHSVYQTYPKSFLSLVKVVGVGKDKGLVFLYLLHSVLIMVIIINFHFFFKFYYLDSLPLFYYVLYYNTFVFIVIFFN